MVFGTPPITLKIWDSVSGEEIFTLLGHDDALIILGWSPSGDRILTDQ